MWESDAARRSAGLCEGFIIAAIIALYEFFFFFFFFFFVFVFVFTFFFTAAPSPSTSITISVDCVAAEEEDEEDASRLSAAAAAATSSAAVLVSIPVVAGGVMYPLRGLEWEGDDGVCITSGGVLLEVSKRRVLLFFIEKMIDTRYHSDTFGLRSV